MNSVALSLALLLTPFQASALTSWLKCNSVLTEQASESWGPDPVELAIQDPEFRTNLLRRKKSRADLHFPVPEFRRVIADMLAKIPEIERRAYSVETSNPLHILRQELAFPVKAAILKHTLTRLLRSELRYWDVIEASVNYAMLANVMLRIEGKILFAEIPAINDLTKVILSSIKKGMRNLPVIYLPTANEISIQQINRFQGAGLLLFGTTIDHGYVDGTRLHALGFSLHDVFHGRQMIADLIRLVRPVQTEMDFHRLTEEQYLAIDRFLSANPKRLSSFFAKVDALPDQRLKDGIEYLYFNGDHEAEGPTPLSLREYAAIQEKELRNVQESFIRKYHDEVDPMTFPENLKSEPPEFWQAVAAWIDENWEPLTN